MMKKIKNIIFDFGNVFIDIDFNKTKSMFESYGITDYSKKFGQHHASPLFQDFETGKLTPQGFLDGFRITFNTSISNEQIIDAWNAMLGHFSPAKMSWLENVNKQYKTFLFSNTNLLHQLQFEPQCEKELGKPLKDYFVHTYYSHDLGLRKPEPESFEKIIHEQYLDKTETLFVDDTIGNIDGAQKVGLSTYFLDLSKGMKVEDIQLN